MKRINVGLIGIGTIGKGVYKALLFNKQFFEEKYQKEVVLRMVCDADRNAQRRLGIPGELFTTRYQDILDDKEINVVIELIGGIHPAKEIILSALRAGKHVITANKALLAQELPGFLQTAYKNKVQLRFEASVCGGIPIIKSLSEGLAINRIDSIFGIINGTSNYILSRMSEQGCSFAEALAEAKKKGYAEANPALDIKGFDASHKLGILAYLAFDKFIAQDTIFVQGIEKIAPIDVRYAKELGLRIKPLAIAKRIDKDVLEMRVHPTLIPNEHPLASVNDVFNGVFIQGGLVGDLLFLGKGAGEKPTTSAVMSDLIDLLSETKAFKQRVSSSIKKVKKINDIQSKYYIRFTVFDRPGVLSKISGILARHKISIASVSQKERGRVKIVPVVILTHEAREKDIKAALEKIDSLAFTRKPSVVIHREEI